MKKEALAILEALKKWRYYFLGSKLIIKTDQQSLRFITDQKLSDGIQHKLMMKLLEFDFTIQYKKGITNKDALSRKFQKIFSMSHAIPIWAQELADSYQSDPHFKPILEKLLLHPPGADSDYTLSAGILRNKGVIAVGNNTSLSDKLLTTLHSSPVGGHSGMRATYLRVKQMFFWPGLKSDVEKFVAQCPICQRSKHENCPSPGLLDPLPIPDMAWTHISMDFVEGLPKSQGMEVIFVVVDKFTKYAHFIPMSHPYTVKTVAKAFIDNIIKLHGPPLVIISDRDGIFTSSLWRNIFTALDIQLLYSSSYHPQTDGQTERVNQCVENYLRRMTSSAPQKWASWQPLAKYWYNTTYHTALKISPFQAMYGFPPPILSDMAVPGPSDIDARKFLEERQKMTD